MGLSGISTWGSDIGGFFALFQNELTPELLARWVQVGAVSGVMRTEADGIAVPDKARPQVWDADQIDNWRRYAKLHTQLYPYLVAADDEYQRTGLPLMRQLSLVYPGDATAAGRDDEFMFGPDLLAAPVVEPGATQRSLYLPQGRWVDMWRTLRYRESDGALRMQRATVLRGPGDVTVPAPLDELPLLARAGTASPSCSRTSTPSATTRASRRPRSPTARGACRCSRSRAPRAALRCSTASRSSRASAAGAGC
jgi:alpha-glucosidase (family GH31 glycosyl hydrolase)